MVTTLSSESHSGHVIQYSTIDLNNLTEKRVDLLGSIIFNQVEQANQFDIKITVCDLEELEERVFNHDCHHHMDACKRQSKLLNEMYHILKAAISSTSGEIHHCIHFHMDS